MTRISALQAPLLCLAVSVGCYTPPVKMEPTQRIETPPPGKGLVNFHRPSKIQGLIQLPIFTADGKLLCGIAGGSEYQFVTDPGEHHFIGMGDALTIVKTEVGADKIYDIMVDINFWGNAHLVPLASRDERRALVPEFERVREQPVRMVQDEQAAEFEKASQERIEKVVRDHIHGPHKNRIRQCRVDDCRQVDP